jgi:DNA-binding NtrC family response regulator
LSPVGKVIELGKKGTILLAEDDEFVRGLARRILTEFGYRVHECSDFNGARSVFQNESKIDLLLTDVFMPGISGKELYDQLICIDKELSVIYMSGYTSAVISHHNILDENTYVLQKPFSRDGLLRAVGQALETNRGHYECHP